MAASPAAPTIYMLEPVYSVVLRADLPPAERHLLERFCGKVTDEEGNVLLNLLCTRIDVSHSHYIEVETFKPSEAVTHTLKFPHHLVFIISGAEFDAPIGFAAEANPKSRAKPDLDL
jgi:hypothetical protein